MRLTLLYADVCAVPSANVMLPLGPRRTFEILPDSVTLLALIPPA